jgi:hypothetical protein
MSSDSDEVSDFYELHYLKDCIERRAYLIVVGPCKEMMHAQRSWCDHTYWLEAWLLALTIEFVLPNVYMQTCKRILVSMWSVGNKVLEHCVSDFYYLCLCVPA